MMFPENIWIKSSERAALTGYPAKRRSRACRASADLPLLDRGVKRVHVNMDDFSRGHLGTIIKSRAAPGKKSGRVGAAGLADTKEPQLQ